MIKANELRIGNLIHTIDLIGNKKELYEITPRFFCSIANGQSWEDQKESGFKELSQYVQPIPLTEEWLLKFEIDSKNLRNGILHRISEGYNFIFMGHLISRIKYVHQLQNLYFVLTSEELKTK